MTKTVRTRFAPSPTGDLHLGNLRVAIFDYCFAKKEGGVFLLRIEDTDLDRNQQGSLEGILDDLRWAGLDWDEGPDIGGEYGPYLQSKREDRHRELALELEHKGLAYRCWCSDEGEGRGRRDTPRCPGGCKDHPQAGEGYSLRFIVPDDTVQVVDEVRGSISFHGRDIGDFIILRSDGRPTYNFAVVADDVDMKITHVIRGAGHLSNTPKHALLFDALGIPRPIFAHLPTVLSPDGGKLSKRSGAAGVRELREAGYHPQGVVNYLSLLGWSAGEDQEVLTKAELIAAMDLSRIGATDTAFDPEKLLWMSAQHIARMETQELVEAVRPFVDLSRFPLEEISLFLAIEVIRSRLHTFAEVNEHLTLLFPKDDLLQEARRELATDQDALALLRRLVDAFSLLPEWDAAGAGETVRQVGKELGAKGPALFHPVRLALFGARSGPDLGKMIAAIGRVRTLDLLDRSL